jgi:uncharacterized protein (TIGR02001 family)
MRLALALASSFAALTVLSAHAQQQATQPGTDNSTTPINLGGRGWAGPELAKLPSKEGDAGPLQFSAKAGFASDYIYRGTTLSDRKPAVGAGVEAAFGLFYVGATVATVTLPTRPSAELTFAGGVRPTIGAVDFDFGATYFFYPGEAPNPTNGVDYWEAAARASTAIGETIRVAAGYAVSPNVSNTGAWSQYVAFGAGYQVPARLLPPDLSISLTAATGYSWFGNQSAVLGGFRLPAYLNWQAGVTFAYKSLNLDLRYHDTNLSKEDCFVFTGDPNATPGGRVDPITNPGGLRSRWCSAAVVAKVWLALN